MKMAIAALLCLPLAAQEKPPAPEMTPAEVEFQKAFDNVVLEGSFTSGESKELHSDKYTIDRISKVGDGLWKFEARIQYNGKDIKFAMNVPVKWAGDTPMITLTNFGIPMMGSFNARVLFYKGEYAGTWSANGKDPHGGIMFGKVVKQKPPEQ